MEKKAHDPGAMAIWLAAPLTVIADKWKPPARRNIDHSIADLRVIAFVMPLDFEEALELWGLRMLSWGYLLVFCPVLAVLHGAAVSTAMPFTAATGMLAAGLTGVIGTFVLLTTARWCLLVTFDQLRSIWEPSRTILTVVRFIAIPTSAEWFALVPGCAFAAALWTAVSA